MSEKSVEKIILKKSEYWIILKTIIDIGEINKKVLINAKDSKIKKLRGDWFY